METKICKECGKELPLWKFKMSRYGVRVGVCTDCAAEKMRKTKATKKEQAEQAKNESVKDARMLRLHDFTPLELMQELKRRGYEGKLTFTVTKVINLESLDDEPFKG